jgi:hypothetical protein
MRMAIQGFGSKSRCPIVQPLIQSFHEFCLSMSAIVQRSATKGQ